MRRPCIGCKQLIDSGDRCRTCAGEHQLKVDQDRAVLEPWRVVYQNPLWPKMVLRILQRDGYQCRAWIGERRCPNTARLSVHHHPPLWELWTQGLDPYAAKYLYALCPECHGRIDASERQKAQMAGVER